MKEIKMWPLHDPKPFRFYSDPCWLVLMDTRQHLKPLPKLVSFHSCDCHHHAMYRSHLVWACCWQPDAIALSPFIRSQSGRTGLDIFLLFHWLQRLSDNKLSAAKHKQAIKLLLQLGGQGSSQSNNAPANKILPTPVHIPFYEPMAAKDLSSFDLFNDELDGMVFDH